MNNSSGNINNIRKSVILINNSSVTACTIPDPTTYPGILVFLYVYGSNSSVTIQTSNSSDTYFWCGVQNNSKPSFQITNNDKNSGVTLYSDGSFWYVMGPVN